MNRNTLQAADIVPESLKYLEHKLTDRLLSENPAIEPGVCDGCLRHCLLPKSPSGQQIVKKLETKLRVVQVCEDVHGSNRCTSRSREHQYSSHNAKAKFY